jgi:hypothetical protein
MIDYNEEYLTSPKKSFNVNEYAAHHGITVQAAWSKRKRAKKRATVDPAITRAMSAIGTNMVPSVVWDKTQPGYSVLLRPSVADAANVLELVKDAFTDIPAYRPNPVSPIGNDLFAVYPLYDAHIGMLACGKETRGQNYDLKLAAKDMLQAFIDVSSLVPSADRAMVILGGDTLHINDGSNETPASHHKQDTDGRYEKVIDSAIEMVCHSIEYLCERHAKVEIVTIRGNHDENSHVALKVALKQRYRLSDQISFPTVSGMEQSEVFWTRHGKSLVAIHHGDKAPPQRLCMIIADKCAEWSNTTDRHVLTGHKHTLHVQDFPGVTHHTLRAFAPPDAYGSMFGGRRSLTAMVFDAKKGLILTAQEPILR